MSTFVRLTRQEFEDWLDRDLGYRGRWSLKQDRGGVYHIHLSDRVAIEINSTTGTQTRVMGRGRASMKLRLISRINGHTLNKKSMGQSHFARTINWKKNWKAGVERVRDAYLKSPSFYEKIADKDAYKAKWETAIQGIPGWENNPFLMSLKERLEEGKTLSDRQEQAVERSVARNPAPRNQRPVDDDPDDFEIPEVPVTPTPVENPLIQRLRVLWVRARDENDSWVMGFAQSVGQRLKSGQDLIPRQEETMQRLFTRYRVAGTLRVADRYLNTR